jgi:uracil-DNA glycosylase family 4
MREVTSERALQALSEEIVSCRKCPRLVVYREQVAREKRRAFRECDYWGKPVPGFGDPHAQLLIVGLAPGAHGSNRTGRMFTGDRSGEFLYAALYKAGFANQPTAVRRGDGLRLVDAYITAAARCAPPDNKPLPQEILNCRSYLEREMAILRPRAVLALGKIAWDSCLKVLRQRGEMISGISRSACLFAHGAELQLAMGPRADDAKHEPPRLFGIYHPSQQNTQTGRVTAEMYAQVLERIQRFLKTQIS